MAALGAFGVGPEQPELLVVANGARRDSDDSRDLADPVADDDVWLCAQSILLAARAVDS